MRWVLLLLLLVVLSGCATQPTINPQVKTPEPAKQEDQTTAQPEAAAPVKLSCEQWAESMYPYSWTFKQEVTQDPKLTRKVITLDDGKWKDGSMIRGLSSTKIEPGSKLGENINYYYSRASDVTMDQKAFGFIYNERAVAKDGTVLGDKAFKIQPVFRLINDFTLEEKDYNNNTINMRYFQVEILEANLVSCMKAD